MVGQIAKGLVAGATLLAAACASAPKEPTLTIYLDESGALRVAAASDSPEDLLVAAIMQQALADALKAEPQELTEEEIWREEVSGHVTHLLSGAQCPADWAGMKRERLVTYAPDGTDVGCNYSSPAAAITFYVYDHGTTVKQEIEGAIDIMKARQPVSNAAPFSMHSERYVSHTLVYRDATGAAQRTSVLVAEAGGWTLKVRITCPENEAGAIESFAAVGLLGQMDRLQALPMPPPRAPGSPI